MDTIQAYYRDKYVSASQDALFYKNLRLAPLWIGRAVIAELFQRLPSNDATLLDIGCDGQPLCYIYAPNSAYQIIGLDFARGGLELARRRASAVKYCGSFVPVLGDALRLPFRDEAFDIVVHGEVLEIVDRQSQAIQEISRVLKPGGIIILYTYNKDYWLRSIWRTYHRLFNPLPATPVASRLTFVTASQLQGWFKDSNLKVERLHFCTAFVSAIWDALILPWLTREDLSPKMGKLISCVRAIISKLAIIDKLWYRWGQSSFIVIWGKKL